MTGPAQLLLDLPHLTGFGREDFLVSGSNELAVRMIDDWANWPMARLALIGPARSGKSHLTRVWAHQSGAEIVGASDLAALPILSGPVAIEDVDRLARLADDERDAAETALFHLHNELAAAGSPMLLTGLGAPTEWRIRLPDLRSRLGALSVAEISPPDDALLSSVLVKLATDRQVQIPPKVIGYILKRIERSFAAAEALAERIDAASLRDKRPVTIQLVKDCTGWTD